MRILLDTNILISGLWIAGNPPARLLDAWRAFRFELVISQGLLDEIEAVLRRPKINKRISPERTARFLEDLKATAVWVDDLPVVDLSPDPKDNHVLATAIAGSANLIVSGDHRGMLDLGEINGIPIITARAALEQLGLEEG